MWALWFTELYILPEALVDKGFISFCPDSVNDFEQVILTCVELTTQMACVRIYYLTAKFGKQLVHLSFQFWKLIEDRCAEELR